MLPVTTIIGGGFYVEIFTSLEYKIIPNSYLSFNLFQKRNKEV